MGPAATLAIHVAQRFSSGVVVAPSLDAPLDPGSILVLFGPSGAGKTTILRQLAGLERPDSGTIHLGDVTWCDVARGVWRSPQQRRVGIVFQEPMLFPHMTVRRNVEYGLARAEPAVRRARADALTQLLGIGDFAARLPRALSGGEAQRVSLARALAPEPRLLLLDEPFAALDVPTRTRLRREVRHVLRRAGTPAILVTHDRGEALALGDRIAVVTRGRVRQMGPVADVFSRPIDVEVAESLGVEAVLPGRVIESDGGLLSVAVGEAIIHAAARDELAVGCEVFACIRAEDVTLEVQSPAHASARNHLAARVVAVVPDGPVDRVALDCGFPLDALITRRSREELNVAPGASITAAVKATCVHLVAR